RSVSLTKATVNFGLFDSGRVDEGRVGANLGFDMRIELGRGHDHRLQAKRRKLDLHVGCPEGFQRFAMKRLDDMARRPGSDKSPGPEGVLSGGNAGLRQRRHLRQDDGTFRAVHREREQFPLTYVFGNKSDGAEIEVNPSGYEFGDRFRAPFKGHMNGHDSSTCHEAFRAHMDSAPDAGRGKIERARLGSGGGNKVTNRLKAPRR